MTTQPEARIQRAIQTALRANGWFVFKIHGGPTMVAGLPDLVVCAKSRFIGLEVKTPAERNNVSQRQQYIHQKIREAEGIVGVVCSPTEAVEFVHKSLNASHRQKNARPSNHI